jgi:hypothetical protein
MVSYVTTDSTSCDNCMTNKDLFSINKMFVDEELEELVMVFSFVLVC